MPIAGIVHGKALIDFWPEVFRVCEFRAVDGLVNAGLDLPLEERPRWNDDVIPAAARKQSRLERFVGIIRVVDDPDSGSLVNSSMSLGSM